MPRHPKGSGKRPQTTERANTAKRKAVYLTDQFKDTDKEELIGIAQGIMCDRAINYLEYPHLKACKKNFGPNDAKLLAKFTNMKGKLKHKYKPSAANAEWSARTFRTRTKNG